MFWFEWVLVCCGFVVTMFSGIFLVGVLFCFCVWYLTLILFLSVFGWFCVLICDLAALFVCCVSFVCLFELVGVCFRYCNFEACLFRLHTFGCFVFGD